MLRVVRGAAGLMSGFLVGQGAMFAVQTWLMSAGEVELVGRVAIAVSVLSAAQLLVDWGGTSLLAKHAAQNLPETTVRAAFWVRGCIALAATLCLVPTSILLKDAVVGQTILFGLPALLAWAFNLTGYLDGKGRSAASGPLSGLSWLGAAAGLFIAYRSMPDRVGGLVGAGFSIGAMLTVAGQFIIATRSGHSPGRGTATRSELNTYLREGAWYSAAVLPGQFYGRSLVPLVGAILGPAPAGIYAYVRNLLSAAAQGVAFVRRVEFPTLAKLVLERRVTALEVLRLQYVSIAASVVFLVMAVSALVVFPATGATAKSILFWNAIFALTVPAAAAASALGMVFVATNSVGSYARTVLLSIPISLLTMGALLPFIGLHGVLIGELLMYGFQAGSYRWSLKRLTGAHEPSVLRSSASIR